MNLGHTHGIDVTFASSGLSSFPSPPGGSWSGVNVGSTYPKKLFSGPPTGGCAPFGSAWISHGVVPHPPVVPFTRGNATPTVSIAGSRPYQWAISTPCGAPWLGVRSSPCHTRSPSRPATYPPEVLVIGYVFPNDHSTMNSEQCGAKFDAASIS